jgi:hypothetical protein
MDFIPEMPKEVALLLVASVAAVAFFRIVFPETWLFWVIVSPIPPIP